MRMSVFGLLCFLLGACLMFLSYEEIVDLANIKTPLATLHGKASFYGKDDGFNGKCMSNGARFNKEAMTAAHKFLPFGSRVRVKYLNRFVEVEITDRGPYKKGRIIDLSEKAARDLGIIPKGVVQVTVEVLEVPEVPQTFFHENPSCTKRDGEIMGKTFYARAQ